MQKNEEKWNHQAMSAALMQSGNYKEKDHLGWVDERKKGVYHLGLPPTKWSISSLAFDMFHSQVNYVKLQARYIRRLLQGTTSQ